MGTLYKPGEETCYPAIVVLHAANGGKRQFSFYQHLTTKLPRLGIAVFLFDRRGSGNSEGDFETASFATLAGDGSAAVDYLKSRGDVDKDRIGLYGISQGGWIAPLVAGSRSDIAFLIIVSGCGVSPAKQMDYGVSYALKQAGYSVDVIAQAIDLRNQVNEYFRGNISFDIVAADLDRARFEPWFRFAYLGGGKELPKDVRTSKWWYEFDYDPLPIWQRINLPVLFLFAENDQWVPIAESMSRFKMATSHLVDVTMLQVEGTDHLMGLTFTQESIDVSEDYIKVMSAWLTRILGLDD